LKNTLKPFAILSVFILIAAAMTALRPEPVKVEAPENALAVKILKMKRTQAVLLIQSQGSVLPRTRTSLISEVSGAVLKVSPQFMVGGTFDKGDTLLTLDPSDYEVALQRAEASLISRQAQLTFEQARATQAKKEWAMTGRPYAQAPILALREPYLDEARANVLQAEAEVKQALQKLQRTTIQYVTVGTPLGESFAIDVVEIRLPLTDNDMAMMNKVEFSSAVDAPKIVLSALVRGQTVTWDADLVRSEGVVNQLNRSQYVVAQVADPYGIIRPASGPVLLVGTFVRASIAGKTLSNVFRVPRHAMLEGKQVALVDAQSRLRLTSVKTTFGDDDFYYVSAGLKAGDEVIVSAIGTAIEGMKVNPQRKHIDIDTTGADK
jgi:multidrug efflux system membrane fusion protein